MKTPTAKLSSNGQIVIPSKIRASMGLRPGVKFFVSENAGEIVLKSIKDNIFQKGTDLPKIADTSEEPVKSDASLVE